MEEYLAALAAEPPKLTVNVLAAAYETADNAKMAKVLATPAVAQALIDKAVITPETNVELTEVLLSQQVILAASRSQLFLDTLVEVPTLPAFLEYLVQSILTLTPDNKVHTVFTAILINLTRTIPLTRKLTAVPDFSAYLDKIIESTFEEPVAGNEVAARHALYLLTNVVPALTNSLSLTKRVVEALVAHSVGRRIVDAATSKPEIAFQYTQLLYNIFLLIKFSSLVNEGRKGVEATDVEGEAAPKPETIVDVVEPLVDHILIAFVCARCHLDKTELRAPGLSEKERGALPAMVKEYMAECPKPPELNAEAYAHLSDSLLLYCHSEQGKEDLKSSGAYPILRELHLAIVDTYGDRCYLADSLLTVIEGIIADSDLEQVN